jgi:hypothetical protein
VETRAYLEQTGNAPPDLDAAGGRRSCTAQYFEQGTLAGTISPDNTGRCPLFDIEVDISQSPYIVRLAFGSPIVGFANLEVGVFLAAHPMPPPVQIVRKSSGTNFAKPVLFGNVFCSYDNAQGIPV